MRIGDEIIITEDCPLGCYHKGDTAVITGMAADADRQEWAFEATFSNGDHWYVDDNCAEVTRAATTH